MKYILCVSHQHDGIQESEDIDTIFFAHYHSITLPPFPSLKI